MEQDEEEIEEMMTDASIKEEDQEIDIASYSEIPAATKEEPEAEEEDIHVDIDKAYREE